MEASRSHSFNDIARQNMVLNQLKPNNVTHSLLLSQFSLIDRDVFLPPFLHARSYSDQELRLPENRFALPPLLLARLIQSTFASAEFTLEKKILVVGCGTGYSLALLSAFGHQVFGLECSDLFVTQGQSLLSEPQPSNIALHSGNLKEGLPSLAPFDIILIEGAVREVPAALSEQLREGGRLSVLLRDSLTERLSRAMLFLKKQDILRETVLFECGASFLPGLDGKESEEDPFFRSL